MLMDGCSCGDCSERDAFGFSNEKSLMYWVRTLSWGTLSGAGPPLVILMWSPSGRASRHVALAATAGGLTQAAQRVQGSGNQGSGIRHQASGIGAGVRSLT